MDFLQQAFAQLSKLVGSMSPTARLTAAGSLVFVVVGAALLSNQSGLGGSDTFLMGRQAFSATQLRDMEGAFGKAGLVDYQIDGDRVRVPNGQQSKYMAALADAGAMPEDFGEYLREAVNSGGFMVSRSQQEAQAKIALQSELQLAISRFPGIKNASVLIAEEINRGFPQTKSVTASVAIEPRDETPIDEATIADIRSYVASSWGGLKPEAVTVVKTNHQPSQAVAEPDVDDRALLWLEQNWQALGLGGLMLAGLVVVWSTVRPAVRPAVPETLPALQVPVAPADDVDASVWDADSAPVEIAQPAVAATDTLRKELAVMIRQDPQAAAGVLRTWIGNAS